MVDSLSVWSLSDTLLEFVLFASFRTSCISFLSVVCPSALLEFLFFSFSFFLVFLHRCPLLLTCWNPLHGVPVSVFVCRLLRCFFGSFGSFISLGLRCLHCFSLWLFLYLCYLLRFPWRFLIWPLLAPFSFFLFFDMVLSCCFSVPAVWNCVTRCFSCSSRGPCILGFLRFVSLLSFPLFPGICPVSYSIPLGLVPVCSGSVSFLRHRLPVLSCLSFSPLLVDSPPPAFLDILAFA